METRVYECEAKNQGGLKKVLEADAYAETSFARHGYKLKAGKSVGGEDGKYYLYIKGEESFFKDFADEKLNGVEGLKKLEGEAAQNIIGNIENTDSAAEKGIGSIFG